MPANTNMDNDGLGKMNLSGGKKYSKGSIVYGTVILGFAIYGMAQLVLWLTEHLAVH